MTEPKPIGTEREEIAKQVYKIWTGGKELAEGDYLEPDSHCYETADFILAREQAARVDELKRAANHNNSEYTSDYIEARLAALHPPANQTKETEK